MEKKCLTVFTPAYNREKLLERAYESLLRQSCHNFKWLIVDDGSKDNTSEKVREWQAENKIEITYLYQENGGKMRAHNTGVRNCDTELFLCLDSDDYLTDHAVEKIITLWEKNKADNIAGIVAHKGESENRVLGGGSFPKVSDSTLRSLYRSGFTGETTLVFRTDVLKKNLFPEIPNEKYVPEDYIYDKIDMEYSLCVLNEILTVCEIVEEGYTRLAPKLRRENPGGWYLYYEQRAALEPFSVLKIKYLSHMIRFAGVLHKNIFKDTALSSALVLLGVPGAFVLKLAGKL